MPPHRIVEHEVEAHLVLRVLAEGDGLTRRVLISFAFATVSTTAAATARLRRAVRLGLHVRRAFGVPGRRKARLERERGRRRSASRELVEARHRILEGGHV